MPSLPSLLKKFGAITLEIAALEVERKEVHRRIVAVANAPRPRKPSAPVDGKRVSSGIIDVVKLLKEASGPLRREEIAQRLGIAGSAAGFRLGQAIKLGFVEKVRHGSYSVTSTVPEL